MGTEPTLYNQGPHKNHTADESRPVEKKKNSKHAVRTASGEADERERTSRGSRLDCCPSRCSEHLSSLGFSLPAATLLSPQSLLASEPKHREEASSRKGYTHFRHYSSSTGSVNSTPRAKHVQSTRLIPAIFLLAAATTMKRHMAGQWQQRVLLQLFAGEGGSTSRRQYLPIREARHQYTFPTITPSHHTDCC